MEKNVEFNQKYFADESSERGICARKWNSPSFSQRNAQYTNSTVQYRASTAASRLDALRDAILR